MDVTIYKPSKNAMQSGRGKTHLWVMECDPVAQKTSEPLMGWTSSNSTLGQIQLKFDTCEQAVAYAEKKSWDYKVIQERNRRVKPKNYTDNFK